MLILKKISRRFFLDYLLKSSVALKITPSLLINPASKKNLSQKSLVSIQKGKSIRENVLKAISDLGGLNQYIKKKGTVFIKPNLLSGGLDGHDPVTSGEIPHPETIATVCEELIKMPAEKILVGEWMERPFKINFGGKDGIEGAQLKRRIELLNKKYGTRIYLINLFDNTSYFTSIKSLTKLKTLEIPDLVYNSDALISIACLKTHHAPSPVTFGMKNLLGILPTTLYGEPRIILHHAGIHQVIADLNKGIRPDLTIVDGSYGLEGEGPSTFFGGKPVDMLNRVGGYITIASNDPVAADAIATRIISKNWKPSNSDLNSGTPYYVNHIRVASQMGIGNLELSKITLKGTPLEEVETTFLLPVNSSYPETDIINYKDIMIK